MKSILLPPASVVSYLKPNLQVKHLPKATKTSIKYQFTYLDINQFTFTYNLSTQLIVSTLQVGLWYVLNCNQQIIKP